MRLLVSSVRCCCGSDPLKSGSEQRLCPQLCLLCSCKPARSANTVCVFLFYFCCPSVCSLKERARRIRRPPSASALSDTYTRSDTPHVTSTALFISLGVF